MQKNNNLILVIEDNDPDFEATKRALKRANLANKLNRCVDGDEALAYLFSDDKDNHPVPNIILLDLNLPGTDGLDVLASIKANKQLRDIPVVILTTSSDEYDINRCYHHGANSYMQKPVDLDRFIAAIQRLNDYWFEVVILPKHENIV